MWDNKVNEFIYLLWLQIQYVHVVSWIGLDWMYSNVGPMITHEAFNAYFQYDPATYNCAIKTENAVWQFSFLASWGLLHTEDATWYMYMAPQFIYEYHVKTNL